jgi:hypothetical protein
VKKKKKKKLAKLGTVYVEQCKTNKKHLQHTIKVLMRDRKRALCERNEMRESINAWHTGT